VDCEAIIVGGSFAGLAVASQLRGRRVLLLDRQPLGEGQTSACAAPLVTLERMGAVDAILKVHEHLIIHTPDGVAVWPSGAPFATFDYRSFCAVVASRLDAEVKIAEAVGVRGQAVLTRDGVFTAPLIVDATGWRASLAAHGRRGYRRPWAMGVGIETEVEVDFPSGLHFFFDRSIVPHGYAWAFPAGRRTRFGVAARGMGTKLKEPLRDFLRRVGVQSGPTHGGVLASGLRAPVVNGIFVVGDAAGHCLPLTGEGIRTAVRAGHFLGVRLREVLEGTLPRREAEAQYRRFVTAQRRHYFYLAGFQIALLHLMPALLGPASRFMTRRWPRRIFFDRYMRIFHTEDGVKPPDGWRVSPAQTTALLP